MEVPGLTALSLRKLSALVLLLLTGRDPAGPARPAQEFRVFIQLTGRTALQVEQQATVPVEHALMGLAEAERIQSVSMAGLGIVTVRLQPGSELGHTRRRALERLASLRSLPEQASVTLEPPRVGGELVEHVLLRSDSQPASSLAETLRERLATVPGAARIVLAGASWMEVRIELDPDRMAALGVGLQDALSAVQGGGSFGRGPGLDELAETLLRAEPAPVRLADVARIGLAAAPRRSLCIGGTRGSEQPVVAAHVSRSPGVDRPALSAALGQRIAQLARDLPPGTVIQPFSGPDLHLKIQVPPMPGLEPLERLARRAGLELGQIPEVEQFLLYRFDPADGLALPDELDLFVRLRPGLDAAEAAPRIAAGLRGLPEVGAVLPQGPGAGSQIGLQLVGPDLDRLVELADQAREAAASVAGAGSVRLRWSGLTPEATVELDLEKLARYGLARFEAELAVEAARGGIEAGFSHDATRRLPVRVLLGTWADPVQRLGEARVLLPDGSAVPLSSIAAIRLEAAPAAITRDDGQRTVGVQVFLAGAEPSVAPELREVVTRAVQLPAGYEMRWSSDLDGL